jgi:hypothetical protein
VDENFTFAVIVSPESFLAQSETLIEESAIIARKIGNERRDISNGSPLYFGCGRPRCNDRNLKSL